MGLLEEPVEVSLLGGTGPGSSLHCLSREGVSCYKDNLCLFNNYIKKFAFFGPCFNRFLRHCYFLGEFSHFDQ